MQDTTTDASCAHTRCVGSKFRTSWGNIPPTGHLGAGTSAGGMRHTAMPPNRQGTLYFIFRDASAGPQVRYTRTITLAISQRGIQC